MEKDQSDFDLETMFNMLDEALTSKDERVQNALRSLLMIVALTRPGDDGKMAIESKRSPLRSMQEDIRILTRRLHELEMLLRVTEKYGGSGGTGVGTGVGGGIGGVIGGGYQTAVNLYPNKTSSTITPNLGPYTSTK